MKVLQAQLTIMLLWALSPTTLATEFTHYEDDVATLLQEYRRDQYSGFQFDRGVEPSLLQMHDEQGGQVKADFARGEINIDAVSQAALQQSIVRLLLTQFDPNEIDIQTANDFGLVNSSKKPFFYNQILDTDGKPIEFEWRAQRYAKHLLQRSRYENGRYWVTIPMSANHTQIAGGKYVAFAQSASVRHQVPVSLVMAIMETESSFNPMARSRSNALGLMQVKANTAGRDYFALIKGYQHTPSAAYLYQPESNIDLGAGYLRILQQRYLKGIDDPLKLEYAVIASYNGGSGNLWKSLNPQGNKRNAIARINRMSSTDFYWFLTNRHNRKETQNYVKKVTAKQRKYLQL
ncbi:murein transglycosylase domain-containing protein [Ferrimonas lipolytica]|uniref:DUF3393 domain-containing protein n=1 Tax=Ferrimonas lipolytica TaxID=2724191 RepID=A0A6H1UHG6_9GAMM|nr:murein transglycosylase domain-containing protein [Ferrimonas lipolytica]QIZ78268.1 DUF3393 domain-containing protein [Ferrimonas lipolytica]